MPLPENRRLPGKKVRLYSEILLWKKACECWKKRYNVEFIIKNNRLKGDSFTGTFTNQRLERILEYFRLSSQIRWRYLDSPDMKDEKSKIEIY